jgi:GT2 family glycosyltransferase
LVDHDDLLSRDAFLAIYKDWRVHPTTQLYYTDECKLNPDGLLDEFWPKADWSPAYLENTMCIGHLAVYQMGFLRALGFRSEFDGTQDFDLALRASLRKPSVRHLPVFAYIWRAIPGSAALGLDQKPYAIERQRRAVLDYAQQKAPNAEVSPGWGPGYWRIKYQLPSPAPLLSYVIPAGGGWRRVRGKRVDLVTNCIRSFEERNFYPNREYVVVHRGNLPESQLRELQANARVVLVKNDAEAFNFSQTLNLGVAHARGEFLCLLNDDVEAITPRGGEELVSYLAANDEVGAMGPLCLHFDGTIQQNGIVLLPAVGPVHAGDGEFRDFGAHQGILRCRREVLGVGAAALFVKKSVYQTVGGFSEDLPLNYNDVDFAAKLKNHGYSCVVDPAIEVYHYESATKLGTSTVEQERLFLKHPDLSDPYFSKWFDPGNPNFRVSLQQRKIQELSFGSWLDRAIARRATRLVPSGRYRFSVLMAVHDQSRPRLADAYKSISMQNYENRELLIIDYASTNPETLEWLDGPGREGAAKVIRVEASADADARNARLFANITGDFIVVVNADDVLSVDALQLMAHAIENNPAKKVFYCDEYQADATSVRTSPFFKPDFDPVLLMNCFYSDHAIAIAADLFRKIEAYADADAFPSRGRNVALYAFALGEEGTHVRELVYAQRTIADPALPATAERKPDTAEARRVALTRVLGARGLDEVILVEPNPLDDGSGLWRLVARKPLPKVTVLDAREVWAEGGMNVAGLMLAAGEPGVDWVAILLAPRDPKGLRELSAVGWLDPRITAVCGLLTEQSGHVVRWSGGLFLPGGRLFDPYAGHALSEGGYHAQLWCQRCVDVPAPVNVLIRAQALVQAAARVPASAGADGLMAMLGLKAHEDGNFIAVTPHLRDVQPPPAIANLPMDRHGLLLGLPALHKGSRWYDGRLRIDPAYGLWDLI